MSLDVGYSFSNNITYYFISLLIKYYRVKIAKKSYKKYYNYRNLNI